MSNNAHCHICGRFLVKNDPNDTCARCEELLKESTILFGKDRSTCATCNAIHEQLHTPEDNSVPLIVIPKDDDEKQPTIVDTQTTPYPLWEHLMYWSNSEHVMRFDADITIHAFYWELSI
jgi:hypothetical protein